jgi:hypothetical protein
MTACFSCMCHPPTPDRSINNNQSVDPPIHPDRSIHPIHAPKHRPIPNQTEPNRTKPFNALHQTSKQVEYDADCGGLDPRIARTVLTPEALTFVAELVHEFREGVAEVCFVRCFVCACGCGGLWCVSVHCGVRVPVCMWVGVEVGSSGSARLGDSSTRWCMRHRHASSLQKPTIARNRPPPFPPGLVLAVQAPHGGAGAGGGGHLHLRLPPRDRAHPTGRHVNGVHVSMYVYVYARVYVYMTTRRHPYPVRPTMPIEQRPPPPLKNKQKTGQLARAPHPGRHAGPARGRGGRLA